MELEEIERNKVGYRTQRSKVNKFEWNEYYNKRVVKLIEGKGKRIKQLDDKWNKPNQATPIINKTPK